jgi:hypothetical protein
MAGDECYFLIDTGYAGPPVLNLKYVLSSKGVSSSASMTHDAAVQRMKRMKYRQSDEYRELYQFMKRNKCVDYTSGCTMRLLGIGSNAEKQSDLLMCSGLEFECTSGGFVSPRKKRGTTDAEVLVTHQLGDSVHILTIDYLTHVSPLILSLKHMHMRMCMSAFELLSQRHRFRRVTTRLSGGSFVCRIEIGGGEFMCTVDTGSPGCVCIGKDAVHRMLSCTPMRRSVRQVGVNGENVCSDVVSADVSFAGKTFPRVPVFCNDTPSTDVDGYIGLGFLQAFDLLILQDAIEFSPNGNSVDINHDKLSSRPCGNGRLPCEKH